MIRPWDRPSRRWRLGLKLAKCPATSEMAIGWAAVRLSRCRILGRGEDTTEAIEARLNALGADEQPEAIELYRYTAASFTQSAAAAGGMPHDEHERRIASAATELRNQGHRVIIKVVT